ncbi:hypothetical protein D3C86_1019530 [compost metagenome]
MPDYGLRARNGMNEIQVDSTFSNFSLKAKGVAVTNANWFHGNFRTVNVFVPFGTGVVAYRGDGPCCLYGLSPAPGGMYINFIAYVSRGAGMGDVTINWYLFDAPQSNLIPAGQNYGLRVKDAAGVVTFDGRIDYMRLHAVRSGSALDIPSTSSGLAPTYNEAVYPGIVPAIIEANTTNSQEEVAIGVGPGVQFMQFRIWQMTRQSGGLIGLTQTVEDYGPNTMPSNWPSLRRSRFDMTVIDVSGL